MSNVTTIPVVGVSRTEFVFATLHGHAKYTGAQLARLNMVLHETGQRPLDGKAQTLRWASRDQRREFIRFELELYTDTIERNDEGEVIVVTLTARRTEKVSRSLQSENRLGPIQAVVAAMAAEYLTANFNCNIIWHYPVEGAELPIRLPFGLPVATASEINSVTGIRVSNEDGSIWVILDYTFGETDSWFHVSSGFVHEAMLGSHLLDEVARRGDSLVAQLVVQQDKGEQ